MDALTEQMGTLERIEIDALHSAFRDALKSQGGQRLVYWMLTQCSIYEDAYTGDAASTNYMLGRQGAGRRLIALLDEIDPRFYPQLLMDIAEIRDRDRAAAEAIDKPESEEDEDYA